ncbi:MAG: hypothetical protein JNL28_01145 [Planctomycetes bacterium]|nr:hypothetical protein [Planctomycetota bacterium]
MSRGRFTLRVAAMLVAGALSSACLDLTRPIEPIGVRFTLSNPEEFEIGRTCLDTIEREFGCAATYTENECGYTILRCWVYADSAFCDIPIPEQVFAARFDADGVLVEVLGWYP